MWLHRLADSFVHAFVGIARTVRAERNFRIHLTVTCYVVWAGVLAELEKYAWCAVLLCFGAVLAAELFNTALEHLCDSLCPDWNAGIGAAKDAAAGAVLVLTLASVAVAVLIFGPWIWLAGPLEHPVALAMATIIAPIAIRWIRGNTCEETHNRSDKKKKETEDTQ